MTAELLPMFPLNNGLVPGAILPLHVFEPRYLEMIDRCLAADGRFGVVLIARGFEVGGGDQRYDVGTLTSIVGSQELDEGFRLVVGRGERRLRVIEWLEDDPYPQAMVEILDDGQPPDDADLRARLDRAFTRGLGLLSEMGVDTAATAELSSDANVAAYQAVALMPIEAIDRQRVLELDDASARLATAAELVEASNELLEAQLSFE